MSNNQINTIEKVIRIKRRKIPGFIFIVLVGSLLHFVYAWSGSSGIIGFFAPVNESVWEHLKMGYWSVILLSLIEYPKLRSAANNYFLAKTAGILALEFTILIVYYSYTWILDKNIFIIDILSYILGALLCQQISSYLMRIEKFPDLIRKVGLGLLIIIGLILGLTTYYTPHLPIFKDHNRNAYGIKESNK
jgi:hypothetical protein